MRRWYYILLVALVAGLTSCDMSEKFDESCYKAYLLTVYMHPHANDDFFPNLFPEGDMPLMDRPREVLVYVFSEQGVLLGTHRTTIATTIELPYKDYDRIRAVAVATAEGVEPEAMFPALVVGQTYTSQEVLYALTLYSENPAYAHSPVDFMYASDMFEINPNTDYNTIYYLYVQPRVSAIKIRTIGLADWADRTYGKSGLPMDEFRFVAGGTRDTYHFDGNLYGGPKSYLPRTTYVDATHIETPTFAMMPTVSPESFKVFIYRNGVRIYPGNSIQDKITYSLAARAPYIIELIFDGSSGSGIGVIPSKFKDIYIHATF